MVRPRTAGDHGIVAPLGLGERAADQLLRVGPAEPHAALGGVHRLGDPEAEIPEAMTEGEGAFPVDGRRQPRIVVGERIGDDMGGGEGHPRKFLRPASFERDRRPRGGVGLDPVVGSRQSDGSHD